LWQACNRFSGSSFVLKVQYNASFMKEHQKRRSLMSTFSSALAFEGGWVFGFGLRCVVCCFCPRA
jgi:hypothetical protein